MEPVIRTRAAPTPVVIDPPAQPEHDPFAGDGSADAHRKEHAPTDYARPEYTQTEYAQRDRARSDPARADSPAPRRDRYAENRTVADFERARRHSRTVALLKIGLPAFAALTVVVILGTLIFAGRSLPSIDIGRTKIENGKLVMDKPHLNGTDSNQRPYDLSADRAIQDADHPTRIMLEKINAQLPMSDTSFAKVTAGIGVYDADAKTLRLSDSVSVNTEDGMSMNMDDAAVYIESGTLVTDNGVKIDTGRASISATTLLVQEKGDRIIFNSNVRMTIRPPSGDEKADSLFIPTMPIIGQISSQEKADE